MRRRDRADAADAHDQVGRPHEAGIVWNGHEPVGDVVGAGEDGERARHRKRRRRLHRADARMRMGRAHEGRMRHPRQHEVVAITALPGQQAEILLPPHRLADTAHLRL